jgi:DNA-binding transcriptional MerR regulator
MKRAGGRRFYRPQDIAVLAQVRRLLHEEGYTIKGVQKLHRELGAKRFLNGEAAAAPPEPTSAPDIPPTELSPEARRRLREVLAELEAAKARLDELLSPRP